jgi:hypothetical protein
MFDLIPWIPIDLIFFSDQLEHNHIHLVRILKMIRIPRLAQLLDIDKFKKLIFTFYNNKLKAAIAVDDYNYHIPIFKIIKIIYLYRVVQILAIIISISYFVGSGWRIYIKFMIDWENNDMIDVYNGYYTFYNYPDYGFVDQEGIHDDHFS